MAKVKIVGTQFSEAYAEGIESGDTLVISHEPENRYDNNALKVTFDDEHLGYIGKGTDLYEMDRSNFPMEAKVVDFLRKVEGDNYIKHKIDTIVSLTLEVEDVVELFTENNIASFNEEDVIINFNEETHTYNYNGTILKGATTFIKKYIQKFDSDSIASKCVTYWGVPLKTIKSAWEIERVLAENFGTAIHKAIEHEELYRKYHKPKDGSRCFNIKHPVLKRIVTEFYQLNEKLGFQDLEVIPEALVSDVDNGLCGLADRILITSWEDKTCILQDYKVNHSFNVYGQEKFINLPTGLNLPPTKLSKLTLQLNFHKRMLELCGWTVEKMGGFVYEKEWLYYDVDSLDQFNILTGEYK